MVAIIIINYIKRMNALMIKELFKCIQPVYMHVIIIVAIKHFFALALSTLLTSCISQKHHCAQRGIILVYCVHVCIDCYSCSRINEVKTRVSIIIIQASIVSFFWIAICGFAVIAIIIGLFTWNAIAAFQKREQQNSSMECWYSTQQIISYSSAL